MRPGDGGHLHAGADTIVVGAGSAGAVIAARITERGDREVLLLEAGPDYPDAAAAPADLRDGTRNSLRAHDWGLRHRPGSRQLVFPFPRGRVVGGSSAVNTCIALRGVPSDYDEWAARGNPEWSFARCLPAFRRLETDLDVQNEWHGASGPVPLRRHVRSELVPWQAAFLDACEAVGHPRTDDHNDPRATGYGPHVMNKVGGVRMSAARCYLTAAVRARPNLALRPDILVRRVLVERGRATGLEVETAGRTEVLRARRVVLAAGAIATPGILLRSGIGPRRELDRLGVAVVRDLPGVGARLLDHPGAAFFLLPCRGVGDVRASLIQTALRLRSAGGEHANDLQIQAGSGVHLPSFSLPLVSLMCQVGKPRGHGLLRYPSADPHARPRIDSRLLEDPHDRALAVEALLLVAAECARAAPMRDLARVVWPPERALRRPSLDAWVRSLCDSGYHPCGTAPMGPDEDPAAVVDERGRVRGVAGLLVADASIMPTIPTANTNLTALMIGERFGEWLRAEDPLTG